MGLDMYLSKSTLIEGYTFKEINTIQIDLDFLDSYTTALNVMSDFDKNYNPDYFWRIYGVSDEEQKKLIREGLVSFINKDQEKYLELKDKYDDEIKKQIEEIETTEIGYWRKANHIHNWFVENVQSGVDDCERYVVSEESLEKLLVQCQKVLNNPELTGEFLPTTGGFFFGSTDYDEHYYASIESTIDFVQQALEETDFTKEVVLYSSSW